MSLFHNEIEEYKINNSERIFTGECKNETDNTKRCLYSEVIKNENISSNMNILYDNSYDGLDYNKPEIKLEFKPKLPAHSIIGINNYQVIKRIDVKLHTTVSCGKNSFHESLQRINCEKFSYNHYQQHWFSSSLEKLKLEDRSREERLEITRYELRRHLQQITKCNLGKSNLYTEDDLLKLKLLNNFFYKNRNIWKHYKLVPPHICYIESCKRLALPCANYCMFHIMHSTDQVLFDYCTAKFADNTQCSVPVFDITHELPLCLEHARKRDNYKMYQETKPKKVRKKVKLSAMIRPQKRSKKKKKRFISSGEDVTICKGETTSVEGFSNEGPNLPGDMVEQELTMQEPDGLELVAVEHALATQASNLLEESEINNVLSTIRAEEFNDFFTVNRNGEYEPTREEAEELERALAAVDNDVKSLEKLSQSQGLLDSLLDEHTLVESLVQIPDVFHNGYVPCGENIVTQSSRLLSIEPHSHS